MLGMLRMVILAFGLVLVGASVVLWDMNRQRMTAGLDGDDAYTLAIWVSEWPGRLGLTEATPAPAERLDITAPLPPAPPGWVRSAYVPADGMVVTGAQGHNGPLSAETGPDMLRRMDLTLRRADQAAVTYLSPSGARVIVVVAWTPRADDGMGGAVEQSLAGFGLGDAPPVFAEVDGVAWRVMPHFDANSQRVEGPTGFRLLDARPARGAHLQIVTDAGDADLAQIALAIDMAAFRAMPAAEIASAAPAHDEGFRDGTRSMLAGLGLTEAELAAAEAAFAAHGAEGVAAIAPPPAEGGGGLMGLIGGFFGGGDATAPDGAPDGGPDGAPAEPVEVRVGVLDRENCTMEGGIRRCAVPGLESE
jgi:hypothetical protein